MAKWQLPTKQTNTGGVFQIIITKPGHNPVDVTYFRNVPTGLDSFSNADPFGDSTAVLTFPQITAFDDPDAWDLTRWFGLFSNVDIYWVLAQPFDIRDLSTERYIDPLTNQRDIVLPVAIASTSTTRFKVWEGYVSSIDLTSDDTSNSVQLQCQGALFQLDRYLQKPFYPPRPYPLETLIRDVFDPKNKPHLRTKPLSIIFPTGWTKKIPPRSTSKDPSVNNSAYVIEGKAGANWSGYATRQTGSWERCLTGFVQDQLPLMLVRDGWGDVRGNIWTVNQQRTSAGLTGRTPTLLVRSTRRTPDFTLWVGTPGVTMNFTHDGTQMANIVYGDGTGIDGTTWNNAIISNDGSRTDYAPLAWIPDIYPYTNNKIFSKQPFAAEAYLKFGAGFEQDQAIQSADVQLQRDVDSGYTGSINLKIDPADDLSRWTIRAGMTVKVRGIIGTGTDGVNFHISEANFTPADGAVSLTVDSKYRDLLTVQEVLARTRDPLTPTRMLNINRTSVMIEDLSAPWSYTAGSGFIPQESTAWWKQRPSSEPFPYPAALKKYPPKKHIHWYVTVKANAKKRADRWSRVPVLTAERGTIRRIEVICVDINGNILKIPYHLSLYYVRVTPTGMPRDAGGPSPYINNAFTTVNPATGNPWPPGNFLNPEPSLIDGALWGGRVNGHYNRAGFYPGSEALGSPVSGLFVDNTPFSFDNTSGTNQNWNPNAAVGTKQKADAITIYAMFYAEYKQPVYFLARMWRQEPGTS